MKIIAETRHAHYGKNLSFDNNGKLYRNINNDHVVYIGYHMSDKAFQTDNLH
jgi:hypothetical protein